MDQAERIISLWKEADEPKFALDLRGLGLRCHPEIPSNVEILYLNGNYITELFLPDSIRILDVSNNSISFIHHLPASLKELYADNNSIDFIAYFPQNLKYIKLCGNNLSLLPELPKTLRALYVSNNCMTKCPRFPSLLRHIDISYNNIKDCSALPENLKYLWCYANKLKRIPDIPENLLGGSISYKNPVPDEERQHSLFPYIRSHSIKEYRQRLVQVKIKNTKAFVDLIREDLMAKCWNPETELGRYLIMLELDD